MRHNSALHSLSIVILASLFAGCGVRRSEPPSETHSGGDYIENFRVKHSKSGTVVWELKASQAQFRDKEIADLTDIDVEFRAEGKKSIITAKSGWVNIRTNEIRTYGATIMKSDDRTIYATDVSYDPKTAKIRTKNSVRILTSNSEITGSSMVSDTKLESIVLTEQKIIWKSR